MRTITTGEPLSVSAVLAGLDDDALTALFELRPDLAQARPATFAMLADRVCSPPSALAAYRTLDRSAQQVIEALLVIARPAAGADLASALDPTLSEADLARPLAELSRRALVFLRHGQVHVNPGILGLRHPAKLGPRAAVVLGRETNSTLALIAKRLELRPPGTKSDTLAAIAGAIGDLGRLRRLLRTAPEGTAELAMRVGQYGPEVVVPYGPAGLGAHTPAGWMLQRGLLAPTTAWDRLVMPAEAGIAFRGGRVFPGFSPTSPTVPTTEVDSDRVDSTGAERALRLVADVAILLEDWSKQPPKLLKDGGIGVRDVRRAAKAIDRDERDTARVVELAAVAGLVTPDPQAGLALLTDAYDAWVAVDAPARWGTLALGWLRADIHVSIAGAIDVKEKRIPALLHRRGEALAVERRVRVLAAMAGLPPGSAAEPDDLGARARWERPGDWEGGPAPNSLTGWVIEEAELLGISALGSLTAAGRGVVAGTIDDAVAALAQRAPASVSHILIQADLTAVAPGALAPAMAAEMEVLTDVESRGAATVYRFTDTSLRRALDAGRSSDAILAFLEEHAARGVPQPLAYLVADLGRRHGKARVGSVRSYLRSDDEALLDELARGKAVARLGFRRLAPTVLVAAAEPPTVLAALRGAGYLPAEEDATGALVVSRPAARRAASSLHDPSQPSPKAPAGRLPGLRPPDLAAIVAGLRRATAPRAAASSTPKRPSPPPAPPSPILPMWRPTDIAKEAAAIADLLDSAADEEWVVRISYTNGKGVTSQLNVVPIGLSDDAATVLVECLPRCDIRTLPVARIHWARVLTEAEEEQLF